jgi:phenylpropionate dioxygenase-like ring-hydroxylating dioxygenase large terminal subunit
LSVLSASVAGLDGSALEKVLGPVETARGLPNAAYIDPAVFAVEQERVFARNWACIGFAKDLPNAGDLKPIELFGRPMLMVRDGKGQVRVFENVCRHRGMTLVDAPRHCNGLIRCPYHSWSYDLEGALRATPHVGGPGQNSHPEVKREELGLFALRSHVWMDLVFVNLSGQAPDFETHIAKLDRRWREFARQPLHHGGADSSTRFDLKTNWKLAVENYCESYHLPWVHPGLNSYSRLEDHYNIVEPGAFSGQGSRVYNPQLGSRGERFASFADLSAQWDHGAEYASLFPNVLLGVHKDHFFALMLEPVAPDRTIEHLELYYADPAMLADGMAEMRRHNTAMWRQVFLEDVFVVEGMQRGRHAAGFDGGKFSPVMDAPTHCFHEWVARQLLEELSPGHNRRAAV